MDRILYYPYINLPRTDWTLRALLYYDNVGSIVPDDYFYEPERNYDSFMLNLVRNELVTPISPMKTFDNPWEVGKPFIRFVDSEEFQNLMRKKNFLHKKFYLDQESASRIHAQKFDGEIFYSLEQLGLAKRDPDNWNWFVVEKTTAKLLMKFLASVISLKLNMQPTTDIYKKAFIPKLKKLENKKRDVILERLLPLPGEVDFRKVMNFKEKYKNDLNAFRNKIEQFVLDTSLETDSDLFRNKLQELETFKKEISSQMKKSNFKDILFGTVCGLVGASYGMAVAETTGAVIGGLPGFANAVYFALKIENKEKNFDATGMKYLAILDKRLIN